MEVTLKDVRLSFPELWTPSAYEPGQQEKFRATFLVKEGSASDKAIKAAIDAVAKEAFKEKATAVLRSIEDNVQKMCYVDGDTRAYDGYEGNMALSSANAKRPTVVDRDKTPLTEADGKPYAGCYVMAKVEIWAQNNKYGKGIRAELRGVQFYRDGDAFVAGGVAKADDFEDLSVDGDDDLA